MSDNIPFEIQMEIIKWLPVKPLMQFRSVSKPWKSFIDSSQFIKGYGARHTEPHSRILSLSLSSQHELRYSCLIDDDIETFKLQQDFASFVVSPLLKQYRVSYVVGTCHGLMCLICYNKVYKKGMVVIWNPSIGKSFGIARPRYDPWIDYHTVYGFGVCPLTSDPTVVKVLCAGNMPWHVEVFTLSSGVWNVISSGNLPRQSIELNSSGKVIDRFIYWGAFEKISTDDGESITNYMVVSFDLVTKEFKVVDLPDSLTNELYVSVSVSKLGELLVVYGSIKVEEAQCCGVWVMERDSSFRKLFSICARVMKILGFTKSSEPICETIGEFRHDHTKPDFCGGVSYFLLNTLDVYDPCSQHIKNLGISGVGNSFFMGSYKESLLLLDHWDSHIYSDVN